MKKQATKLTKQEKERIENRLLAIFATALGAEMLCLYLINWFRGSVGFVNTARWLTYILLVLFIVLAVFLKIKSNKFKAQGQTPRAVKYNNWFLVSLAAAISALFIYPTELIARIPGIGFSIVQVINKLNFIMGDPISFRILVIMILVGIYTIAAFIYYGILSSQAHKASLNKGSK